MPDCDHPWQQTLADINGNQQTGASQTGVAGSLGKLGLRQEKQQDVSY